jgi:hypothetical protein
MIRFLCSSALLLLGTQVAGAALVTAPWSPKGGQAGAAFGSSVAPAGDVNGDGWSDVLVGAPLYDNGQVDEGRAYLYLGGPNGLAASPAWTFESNQANAHAGAVVASAGDVNWDGWYDVLVAAPLYDRPGHVDAGVVFLFYGSPTGPHLTPDLTMTNDVTDAHFGTSVAFAGDVNNDYFPEVVVGAPGFTGGQANEGAVYVYAGSNGGLGGPVLIIEGNAVDARFGESVSGAGDVDADTHADVIVGAPGAAPNGAGAAYVLKGSATGLNPVPFATVPGSADSVACGGGVAAAGDVDGDGYADVLVGSPGENAAGTRRGAFRCYRGTTSGLDPSPLFVINGSVDQGRVGAAVATAGDLDGDGYADFAFGDPRGFPQHQGWVNVFYGGRAGTAFASFVGGTQVDSRFGTAVATAGDVDGDGMSEFVVGAPEGGTALEGTASLFFGRPGRLVPMVPPTLLSGTPDNGFADAIAILPTATVWPTIMISEAGYDAVATDAGRIRRYAGKFTGFGLATGTFDGAAEDGLFGEALIDAGDVDRDGGGDFVVGSPFYSSAGLLKRGRARLYRGNGSNYVLDPWAPQGTQADEWFGITLAGRGDVNGDGYMDVAVGAPNHAGPPTREGMVQVFLGGPTGLSAAPAWTKTGTVQNEYFGYRIAMLDFDADGYSDLAVSCASNAPAGPPRVDIFYGGPSGLSSQSAFSLSPQPPLGTYGSALAPVGDYDGDGVCDLVVSAPDEVTGGTVFFYPGSRSRSRPGVPFRTWTSPIGQANAGYALAGGGDLDGDGRADFVVGAPLASNGESGEGFLYVFRGHGGNAPFAPDTTLESNVVDANLGFSLAPLADLNRDGYADIVAGARNNTGAVWGWLGGGDGTFQFLKVGEAFAGLQVPPARLDSTTQVGIGITLQSAAGRLRTGVEFEIRPQGVPFSNLANFNDAPNFYNQNGPPAVPGDNGGLGTYIRFLFPDVAYQIRGRSTSRNPSFPHSRWLVPEGRATGDFDFWTGGSNTAVLPGPPAGVVRLGRIAPNPAVGAVAIPFSLPGRAPVRLDVYDVRGRHVRALARESASSGVRTWDRTDAHGARVRPGLYFVELRSGDVVDRGRIVLMD